MGPSVDLHWSLMWPGLTAQRVKARHQIDHRVCIGSLNCSCIELNQKIDYLNTALIKVYVKNVIHMAGLPHGEDGLSRYWNYVRESVRETC